MEIRSLPKPGEHAVRDVRVERRAVDTDSRTVEIAFSSEAPVDRWYGREILDHKPGACRIGRLTDGGPLLLDHSPDDQVGAVLEASIGADRIGRAKCKVSRSSDGEDVLMDLADGIRTKCSVGYVIHAIVLESSADGVDTYRVTDWEPLEISLVSIPADTSVGVGRSLQQPKQVTMMDFESVEENPAEQVNTAQADEATRAAPVAATSSINPDADAIRSVGKFFKLSDQAERHIMLGSTLADFREFVRAQEPVPIPVTPAVQRIESRIPHGRLTAYRQELFGSLRECEEQAYRAGMWGRAFIFNDSTALRWCREHGVEVSALGADGVSKRTLTGLAPGQNVVVPDELVLPIIDLREQYGLARRLCRVHPMASDTATVPRQGTGATAYFVGRESAPTASDPSIDNITLQAKNVAAETRISNDFADDSVINLADWIATEHARAFAIKEDGCLINGDGTSTYGGIVGLRTAILSLAGAVDAASGHDTFAEIDASDLRTVMAKLPDFPGINPIWLTSKVGQNALFGRLTDAAGGNTKRDLAARMPDQWAGYDIVTNPAMPKVLTDLSDVVMVFFGDLRMGVIFGDRRGMTLMTDPYSLSSYQQVKIISSERFDINCHGVGDSSNAGPIVALIGE